MSHRFDAIHVHYFTIAHLVEILACLLCLFVCLFACLSREIAKVGEKKIYLFTNAGSRYSDDGVDQICSGLVKEGIQLIVV